MNRVGFLASSTVVPRPFTECVFTIMIFMRRFIYIGIGLMLLAAVAMIPYSQNFSESYTVVNPPGRIDGNFRSLLNTQRGVNRVIVNRHGNNLDVTWSMSRTLLGFPSPPRVEELMSECGYETTN